MSPGRKQIECESRVCFFDKKGQWPPGLHGQESSQQVEGYDRSPLRHLWDHICPYGFEFPGRRKTLASWIESSPAAAWRGGSSTRRAMSGWELSGRAQGRPNSNQIRGKKKPLQRESSGIGTGYPEKLRSLPLCPFSKFMPWRHKLSWPRPEYPDLIRPPSNRRLDQVPSWSPFQPT